MKAIQVNRNTLSKISEEILPSEMTFVGRSHNAMRQDEEIYVVVDELTGNSRSSCVMIDGIRFYSEYILIIGKGNWNEFPDDWFEVISRR